ncbi:MFS transporter [Roseateles sp. DB2]|uniref:MFS transporter n=1 Tax=Roseateles sp. DB2 TaxID=3453717 RepID=UPI003EEDDE48
MDAARPPLELATRGSQAARLPWRQGLAYGALALPLAFVSLPLYVSLPHHYATQAGVPLTVLGATLLGLRALDALVDPWLGRRADRLLQQGARTAWGAAALMALVLALAFAGLWQPPAGEWRRAWVWLVLSLGVCTLAFSALSLLHQGWGTRWGGSVAWRTRVTAWREGATLLGVLVASGLPWLLGTGGTSLALGCALVLGLWGLWTLASSAPPVAAVAHPADGTALPSPWRQADFRHLLAVFLINGTASAIPATLLPFFVSDRLMAADWQPVLLLAYFAAGAVGLPAWAALAGRVGLAPAWRGGMLLSVLGFAATPWLAAGDAPAFLLVCMASGLALGADLALPTALLTGLIHHHPDGPGREGQFLGWWTCASKLNLALAAGLALPLLASLGYAPGTRDTAALDTLAWAYAGLPCLLKLLALALLWRLERVHPSWSAT